MSVIKEYRKKRKLTQAEFSEKVGSSLPTVKRWEKGSHTPTLIQAAKICKVLRLPFGKLLNDYKEEVE